MTVNLMNMLSSRYHHTRNGNDLELGNRYGNAAMRLIEADDPCCRYLYGNMGMLHYMQYDLKKTADDLARSIDHGATAVSLTSETDPLRHDLYFNFGTYLYARYQRDLDPADLDRSIQFTEKALQLAPPRHTLRATRLAALSQMLLDKYEYSAETDIIDRSIIISEEARKITPRDDRAWPIRLLELGTCFGKRFERTRTSTDINRAVELSGEAEKLAGVNHEDRAIILNQLARWLSRRHAQNMSMEDFERAIGCAHEALLLKPDNPTIQIGLAGLLTRRFSLTANGDDLDRSIDLLTKALKTSSLPLSEKVNTQFSLGVCFGRLFELRGNLVDLEHAITMNREATSLMPQNHPNRCRAMINEAAYLELRYKHFNQKDRSRSTQDIDEAFRISKKLVQETPLDHPSRHILLEVHGNILGNLSEAHYDAHALDEAIQYLSEAKSIAFHAGHEPSSTLSNYGELLGQRFKRSGNVDDLNKAIEATNQAVKSTSKKEREKALWRTNLGRWLEARFVRVGALQDLHHAIEVTTIAVDSTPQGDVERPGRLNQLSHLYALRHNRENDPEGLDKSINLLQAALSETPPDHPRRRMWLHNIGVRLTDRGTTSQGESCKDDLDSAIRYFEAGLPLPSVDSLNSVIHWTNLGNALRYRFVKFGRASGSADDIDRSIEMLKKVVAALNADDSRKASALLSLGLAYMCRSDLIRNPSTTDQIDALSSFKECFHSHNSTTLYRIQAAREAGKILNSLFRFDEAVELLTEAIELFPALSPRSLSRSDQQHILSQISGIAPMAAAMTLASKRPHYDALMLLERGRGIIAGLLMERTIDMSALEESVAHEFAEVRNLLDDPHLNTGTTFPDLTLDDDDDLLRYHYVSESLNRHNAVGRIQDIIKRIQADPKTKGFLQPPTQSELMKALGDDTIVVINATTYRCDAFVINKQRGVGLVELKRLKLEDVKTRAQRLELSRPYIDLTMLEWIWDEIVDPVLKSLDFREEKLVESLPRIVWVLTGPLTRLPIHAAGRYTKVSAEAVMDRAISSYALSLRGYVHGKTSRRIVIPKEGSTESTKKVVLVSMSKTPGAGLLDDLPFAAEEVRKVGEICHLRLNLDPVTPQSQTREAVLAELGSFIFHFAGHAQSDHLDPSQSGLYLEDGILTVADIHSRRLGDDATFLAYLSACLTGASDADSLVDEAIHLVSACQLAGFRHVIGSLWQVYDASCIQVAESVYEELACGGLSDRSVCMALHKATLHLRNVWLTQRLRMSRDGTESNCERSSNTARNTELPKDVVDTQVDVRAGRLVFAKDPSLSLVKADWIPYVHYGP